MFLITDAYQEMAKLEPKRDHLDNVIKTMKETIEHIDHDYQSEQLLRGYLNVADANFYLLKVYKDKSRSADSKLYYEKSAHLLAERFISKLVTISEASPQAEFIKARLDEFNGTTTSKASKHN
jgi:hypothetical protein